MNRSKFHQDQVINRDIQTKTSYNTKKLKLESISLHFSIKFQEDRVDILYPILQIIETISGQKPRLHFSKKALHRFRLQKGIISGISTKLRKDSIYTFLENFRTILIPLFIKPGLSLEGIPIKSFDNLGNFTINIDNLILFPEIEEEFQNFQLGDKSPRQFSIGLEISFQTNAKNPSEGILLFSGLQFPIILLFFRIFLKIPGPGVVIRANRRIALVAQLDRVFDFGSNSWGFESSQAYINLLLIIGDRKKINKK